MILVTIFYFVQLFLNLQSHAEPNPYCNNPCSKIPNTMCKYTAGGSPMCSKFINGLSEIQKNHVLNIHNQLRQKVALGMSPPHPSASNMMVLTWDPEGEIIAERWAEQCQISFQKEVFQDGCRTKLNGEEGGQNLSVDMPEEPEENVISYFTRQVMEWFLEGNAYELKNKYSYSKDTESYTQFVWAMTTRIGCGFSYNDSETDSMYRFVCNYYTKGNVAGEMMYEAGLACSQCPGESECSKSWPGLCTTVQEDMGGKLPYGAINTEGSANINHSPCILITLGFMFINCGY